MLRRARQPAWLLGCTKASARWTLPATQTDPRRLTIGFSKRRNGPERRRDTEYSDAVATVEAMKKLNAALRKLRLTHNWRFVFLPNESHLTLRTRTHWGLWWSDVATAEVPEFWNTERLPEDAEPSNYRPILKVRMMPAHVERRRSIADVMDQLHRAGAFGVITVDS